MSTALESTACPLAALGAFGSRARPLDSDLQAASLIITLGSLGQQTAGRLHHMLHQMLTPRQREAQVRLLAIVRRRSLRDDTTPLARHERLLLSLEPIAWSDVPGRYRSQDVARWWPHTPPNLSPEDDLWDHRAYNRLLLVENAPLVAHTLTHQVEWLHSAGTGRQLKLARHIYLVASLAEAEGSALLLDLAAWLRAHCRDRPTRITAVVALAGPGDLSSGGTTGGDIDDDRLAAHARLYATLREIDAAARAPDQYSSVLLPDGIPPGAPPALDMIALAAHTPDRSAAPPDALLAEYVITQIAAGLAAPNGSDIPPVAAAADSLTYVVYNPVKLALPTQAATLIGAADLTLAALNAAKGAHHTDRAGHWVSRMFADITAAIQALNAATDPALAPARTEWTRRLTVEGLIQHHRAQVPHGDPPRLSDLVTGALRQLSQAANLPQTARLAAAPDTLPGRLIAALDANLHDIYTALDAAPAALAFGAGHGLAGARTACDTLRERANQHITRLQHHLTAAEQRESGAHHALLDEARHYDTRATSRLRRSEPEAVDQAARTALDATWQRLTITAQLAVWNQVYQRIERQRARLRDAMAQADSRASQFEAEINTCRRQLAQLPQSSPIPVIVVGTPDWLQSGLSALPNSAQRPAPERIQQLYRSWDHPTLPPEHELTAFLTDLPHLVSRLMAPYFRFPDLFHFLDHHADHPAVQTALQSMATLAADGLGPLTPDDPAAIRVHELVCEVPRPFSVLPPAPDGVDRVFVPSPDHDAITLIRLHEIASPAAIPFLHATARRAYDQALTRGLPLHLDRRWHGTMADLVDTHPQTSVTAIWQAVLDALAHDPDAVDAPLTQLVELVGRVLEVQTHSRAPGMPADLRLEVFKLRPYRLRLPPPHCAIALIASRRAPDELAQELYRAVTPLPLEEQFLLVINAGGRHDIDRIIRPLQDVNYTVLVLNEAHVRHILAAREPARALSDFVLSQVRLATVSPFFTRGPVPDHMFFGREREISDVRSKLRTHSVALIGGRRIGKTSTLQRIQRVLQAPDSEYAPYYLDCHGATQYRTFFWLINRRWGVDISPDASPVQFEDVVTALHKRNPGKSLVFLFDEIDSLLVYDRQPEHQETLFRTFRSLSNEKRSQWVFSGEKWLMRATTNPYSALFNFAQVVRLEPLPPDVVYHLIADPFEMLNIWMADPDSIIRRVYQISAGHPNIVQMICQSMVETLDQEPHGSSLLTVDHLDHATSQRPLQEEIVQTIWGQMNPLARLVTLVWPEGERYLTLAQIEALLRGAGVTRIPPEDLERTAKDLELYCFVRPRENDRLELIPTAFPAILDFMTDKSRQLVITRRAYEAESDKPE